MMHPKLEALDGTTLEGQAELWLDPLGNEVQTSECTIKPSSNGFEYAWSYSGKPEQGRLKLTDDGAEWSDTWHQKEPMTLKSVPGSWSIIDVSGTYSAGQGPKWGWRISLSQRPSGELVLQMTNVTPWGERGRAVRMVATP